MRLGPGLGAITNIREESTTPMTYEELVAQDRLREARIQFGDTVTVITDENGLTWQDAVVINTPQGAGDLWQFQRPDESVFALNPYSSSFIRIEKTPRS